MKSGNSSHGYTIVETIIFLAVTGVLFLSAVGLFSGQQDKTRFTQSLREVAADITTVINETESGYYPGNANFTCTASGNTRPTVMPGTKDQGSNQDCIFLGKAIQFGMPIAGRCSAANTSGCQDYAVQTIIGRRLDGTTGRQVQTLEDTDGFGPLSGARPTPITPFGGNNTVDLADRRTLPGGMIAYRVYQIKNGTNTQIATVGFIHALADYSATGSDPLSGSQSVSMIGVVGSTMGDNLPFFALRIAGMREADRQNADQIVVCLARGGATSNRKGAVVIGGAGRQLTTEVFTDAIINVPGNGC